MIILCHLNCFQNLFWEVDQQLHPNDSWPLHLEQHRGPGSRAGLAARQTWRLVLVLLSGLGSLGRLLCLPKPQVSVLQSEASDAYFGGLLGGWRQVSWWPVAQEQWVQRVLSTRQLSMLVTLSSLFYFFDESQEWNSLSYGTIGIEKESDRTWGIRASGTSSDPHLVPPVGYHWAFRSRGKQACAAKWFTWSIGWEVKGPGFRPRLVRHDSSYCFHQDAVNTPSRVM